VTRLGKIVVGLLLPLGLVGLSRADPEPTVPREAQFRWYTFAVRDGLAYGGRTAGLVILDVDDPVRARQVGGLTLKSTIRDIALAGDLAYLAAGSHGLYVADLSDPLQPELIERFDTPGSVRRVVLDRGHAYLADHRQGLRVVELARQRRPVQVASVSTRGEVTGLALDGERLAIAERLGGVRLFDVAKPRTPRERAVLRSAQVAWDVALTETRLLVAAGRRGLLVYDRADRPELVGILETDFPAEAVCTLGPLALVSTGTGGLVVAEVSGEGAPREVSRAALARSHPVGRIRVHEGRAYIASGTSGFGVVDLSDPERPEVLVPVDRPLKITFP
jgi:hypothetical protein